MKKLIIKNDESFYVNTQDVNDKNKLLQYVAQTTMICETPKKISKKFRKFCDSAKFDFFASKGTHNKLSSSKIMRQ